VLLLQRRGFDAWDGSRLYCMGVSLHSSACGSVVWMGCCYSAGSAHALVWRRCRLCWFERNCFSGLLLRQFAWAVLPPACRGFGSARASVVCMCQAQVLVRITQPLVPAERESLG
jgi:hypothetical protein